jgi:hypothetical protein
MGLKTILTSLLFLIFDCKQYGQSSSLNKLSSLHEQIFQDCKKAEKSIIIDKNLILGFKVGMNKEQVLKVADSLVTQGIFSRKQDRIELKDVKNNLYSITRYSLVLNEISQNEIDSKKTIPLMVTFEDDKLNSIGFYLTLSRTPIIPLIKNFINENYGDYKYYDKENETYYWFKNNIRINLVDAGWFPTCIISDSKNQGGFYRGYLDYSDEEIRKFFNK